MDKKLTEKQIRAYILVSGEHEGLSVEAAAKRMSITPQAVNRLLSRAKEACPQLFPLLTKQEADVKALFRAGWTRTEIADKLQVSLGRISQIVGSANEKQGIACERPVKMLSYQPYMDSQIRKKF